MKAINYCVCGHKMVLITSDVDTIYDLSYGWVCPKCKRINEVKSDVWRQ